VTRRAWIAAAALVAAANAVVLARVASNRRGPVEAELTLTERELQIAAPEPSSESSGIGLRFALNNGLSWIDDASAEKLDPIDPGKLAALGFDVAAPSTLDEAQRFAERQPPRGAFAVLQQGGGAWERYRKSVLKASRLREGDLDRAKESADSRKRSARRELLFASRLLIVDVGRDPEALRRLHPDRSVDLIVPARVRVYATSQGCTPNGCRLSGRVELLIEELTVPRRLQGALPAPRTWTSDDVDWPPRYEVVVRSGRRREPWVQAIRPLAAAR
jgi:hypothetical protein